jgi:hypothetical protein
MLASGDKIEPASATPFPSHKAGLAIGVEFNGQARQKASVADQFFPKL